jgi:hypothetical protein
MFRCGDDAIAVNGIEVRGRVASRDSERGKNSMLTVVFLIFLAIFAIAGFFISLEAKRRRDGSRMRPVPVSSERPQVNRATPPEN